MILSEKRLLERRELIYYLKVRDVDTDKELGRMVDIHSGGILLMGSRALVPDREHQISMEMPKAMMEQGVKNITVRAKVMWTRPSKTTSFRENGMMFLNPSEADRKTIDRLIEFFALPNGSFNLT
jgi:c-di-GMP-binding flagellar brake protein YcgR